MLYLSEYGAAESLTLANVVKPTSVSWEQRATSNILKAEPQQCHAVTLPERQESNGERQGPAPSRPAACSISRPKQPIGWKAKVQNREIFHLRRGQFCPRACRMASVMLAQPDTHSDCRRWQPRQIVMSPSSVICCSCRHNKRQEAVLAQRHLRHLVTSYVPTVVVRLCHLL